MPQIFTEIQDLNLWSELYQWNYTINKLDPLYICSYIKIRHQRINITLKIIFFLSFCFPYTEIIPKNFKHFYLLHRIFLFIYTESLKFSNWHNLHFFIPFISVNLFYLSSNASKIFLESKKPLLRHIHLIYENSPWVQFVPLALAQQKRNWNEASEHD